MRQLWNPVLAAALLFAGASLQAQEPEQEQKEPVQDYSATISRVFREALKAKDSDPQQALALYDELFQMEPPAGDFDSDQPDVVNASYDLYSNLAKAYWYAAMQADALGQWEKAAAYFTKAGALIVGPAEKAKAAYPKFVEGYEDHKRHYLDELERNAEKIKALEAKDEAKYTNDDFTELDHVQELRRGIDVANRAIGYYADRIEKASREVTFYNPEMPFAERTNEKIKMIQDQINKYKGGPGNKVKWVEGIVSDYQRQLPGYATTPEEKLAFAYRLTVLSPNSKTAKALVEWLKGNASEADLKRAIAASRPAKK